MAEYFHESNRLAVGEAFDVAVAGAGIAGIAAALAAARAGMKTLLVEKGVLPGGLATSGLIVHYLPLCDGMGRKVMGGIAEELLRLSVSLSDIPVPENWRSAVPGEKASARYEVYFNPGAFVLALDEVLEKAGVRVLYDTSFSNIDMRQGECRGIIVENLTGRYYLPVKFAVDATGSADVFFKAGAELVPGVSELSFWALYVNDRSIGKACREKQISDALQISRNGFVVDDISSGTESGKSQQRKRLYEIAGIGDMTEYILNGRKLLRKYDPLIKQGKWLPVTLPSMSQHRMIRRIRGENAMTLETDTTEQPVGTVSDWRKAGPVYQIPFGALYQKEYRNLAAAGRCIAAAGDAWEIMRCIPQAAVTGQIAGMAAALSVKQNCPVGRDIYRQLVSMTGEAGIFYPGHRKVGYKD